MPKLIKIRLKPSGGGNFYQIIFGVNTIKKLPKAIKQISNGERVIVITDSKVNQIYGKKIIALLVSAKFKAKLLSFKHGEKQKRQKTVSRLQDQMLKFGCNRNCVIVALGGGVVGDVAGFIAATFMRGVPFIQVPTTLLAVVDSSIGGKVGIDTKYGKNLIGAFHQPKHVLIDYNFLKTLPRRQFINGLVEAIKIFLIIEVKMFAFVEANLEKILAGDNKVLSKVIEHSVRLKAQVVERDEKDRGERMILNLGHTVGHALEAASNYQILHGEAVAAGIIAESRMSRQLGLLSFEALARIEKLINKLGIEASLLRKFNVKKIINIMKSDKKGEGRFVLLKDLGKVFVLNGQYTQEVDKAIIKKVLT